MNSDHSFHGGACSCCMHSSCEGCATDGITRRSFITGVGAAAGAAAMGGFMISRLNAASATIREEGQPVAIDRPLKMKPVLIYSIPQRRKAGSWRSWGGIQTHADVSEEKDRINKELNWLKKNSDFNLEFLPLAAIQNQEQAAEIAKGDHDGVIMFAAGGWGNVLETLADPKKWNIMFVRHRTGPVYLWYEIAHNRFLRKTVDQFGQPGMDVQDVVVDSKDDLLWRLRAFHGLKNTLGKRIVAVGGPSGWGVGGQKAPKISRNLWNMEIIDVPYDDLGKRIKKARQDANLVKACDAAAKTYLKDKGTTLDTSREFVKNAFILTEVFKDVMFEAGTDAITINSCMGTIMPMSETTACLPLSLLNDQGCLAFCESDFVVIPSGILLHYISNKPVFLNDPTYPHHGVVTLAHCTAPRRMDGEHLEKAKILTHFESDYGAAPKVEMPLGQKLTTLAPDFDCKKWVGFEGEVEGNPFMDICRSQIDVALNCDTDKLVEEMRGFHWMTCYGDYLKEAGYALKKVNVDYLNLTKTKSA
ncbi:MAG: twin-arginine translocation signal domain-containing protein [Verrucomicrobia bacterium]|nr:twin-arginine translocation signal domain-containing protein [Verrucomicrobiota bacterium]